MFSRADRVRKTLMKELSDILHRGVKDPRIEGVVSITDIELPSDFSLAKIYVSIYGSEEHQTQVMEALAENAPKMRKEIGRRIRLRNTPELRFYLDNSLERGSHITDLINKISRGEI